MAIDPVSTLVFIKPVIFPIHPSAGRLNTSLNNFLHYTFFNWLEEMTFLQRFIIFLFAIYAALYVSAAPVHVRHLHAVKTRSNDTISNVMVTLVTAMLCNLTDGHIPQAHGYCVPFMDLSVPRPYPLAGKSNFP